MSKNLLLYQYLETEKKVPSYFFKYDKSIGGERYGQDKLIDKYDKKGKYLLFEVEVDRKYSRNMKRFGTLETTDKMSHYYIWRPLNEIYNLHPRLKNLLK